MVAWPQNGEFLVEVLVDEGEEGDGREDDVGYEGGDDRCEGLGYAVWELANLALSLESEGGG